jgi:hypothetical protein
LGNLLDGMPVNNICISATFSRVGISLFVIIAYHINEMHELLPQTCTVDVAALTISSMESHLAIRGYCFVTRDTFVSAQVLRHDGRHSSQRFQTLAACQREKLPTVDWIEISAQRSLCQLLEEGTVCQ